MDGKKPKPFGVGIYNHGKAYPWPCRRCGALVVMEKFGYQSKTMHIRCPECGYEEQRSD